jgi:eukaryotic-like serine/threonine-protein kinase
MAALPQPSKIGRFQVLRMLGRGGQGVVYLAQDPRLNREVAIKTMNAATPLEAERLLEEARAVGVLKHPSIVPVFEADEDGGMPYLVFEYVKGEALDRVLKKNGALPVETAVRMMAKLLDGLAHAHLNGVLHRDIKPSNIMVGESGLPQLMDFGAAARSHGPAGAAGGGIDADFIGTPAYMAPEYVTSRSFSVRTDIFACALVFCEMVTGKRMFDNDKGTHRVMYQIANENIVIPPSTALNERMVKCLLKALARDPDQRHGDALELKNDLERSAGLDSEAGEGAGVKSAASTLEFLLRRMRQKKEFPALSESVLAINRIVHSDKESITSLTNAVLQDVALTNKILKLVNSSFYKPAGAGSISTISNAAVILGFDTIRNIVISLLLFDQMQNREHARQLMEECVRSILTGVIAKEVGTSMKTKNAEEIFVCAMLSNLGRLLVTYYFPEEAEIINKIVKVEEVTPDAAARRVLGISLSDLSVGVAKTWGFPERMMRCMDASLPRPAKANSYEDVLWSTTMMAQDIAGKVIDNEEADPRLVAASTFDSYKRQLPLDPRAFGAAMGIAIGKFGEYARAVSFPVRKSATAQRIVKSMDAPTEIARTADSPPLAGAAQVAADAATASPVSVSLPGSLLPDNPALDSPATGELLSAGIQDLSNAIVEERPLSDVLRIMLEAMYRAMGFRNIVLAIRDTRTNVIAGRFGLGPEIDTRVKKLSFPVAYAPDVFHVAMEKNLDIIISDTADPKIADKLPDWYRNGIGAPTFMLFPLIVKGKQFGMVYADQVRANSIRIGEADLKLLRTLRNQALIAIRQG